MLHVPTAGGPEASIAWGSDGTLYYALQAYGDGEGPRKRKTSTTETQDNFAIVAQFAPLPAKESSAWPMIASVLGEAWPSPAPCCWASSFLRGTRRAPA